jgi:hypothetical protein
MAPAGFDMAIWGDYFRRCEYSRRHRARYVRFVEMKGNGFTCQECKGHGGWVEPVLDFGQGPWFDCGFCEGTGLVTRWMRGQWLRWKAQEKREWRAVAVKPSKAKRAGRHRALAQK